MIDYKYFAGFVDADGSIGIHIQKRDNDRYGLYPKCQIGQLSFRANNLKEIAEEYNVSVTEKRNTDFSIVELTGRKALRFIEHIKGHLVIKDEVADYILNLPSEVSKEELKAIKKVVKSLRKKSEPTRNHPSRKWMAGYIDGDGCFYARTSPTGTLNCKLIVASSVDASAGLKLLQKAFGGSIRNAGNTCHWETYLGVSKAKQILDFCGSHLRIKKTQSILVRDYICSNKHSKYQGATAETNKEFCKLLATTKYIGRS